MARNPRGSAQQLFDGQQPETERTLRFNVRIATPPAGQDCAPGVGSSYVVQPEAGRRGFGHWAVWRFPCQANQAGDGIYRRRRRHGSAARASGAPAGERKNGAKDRLLVWRAVAAGDFLRRLFEELAREHHNFSFHLALSSPLPEDNWGGHVGFIHEVVLEKYLRDTSAPGAVEYYLCGPPMMIKACTRMLSALEVPMPPDCLRRVLVEF